MSADLPGADRRTVHVPGAAIGAVGNRAQVIQYLGNVYNIQSAAGGGPRITATLAHSLEPLLRRHTLFGGRDHELGRLSTFVAHGAGGYLFVTGPSGCGKTAVLANWVLSLEESKQAVVYSFISRLDAG